MRLVLQRVKKANVSIHDALYSSINAGFLILVGIESDDTNNDIEWLCSKVCNMRVFADAEGKLNLDIKQINGELLIVSQFTLYASTKKGNRPSFIKAAQPEVAIPLYEQFISVIEKLLGKPVKTGQFGADMQIELINDGPVTILLDSKNKE
ncbi:MAG: D-tyrosyl-tRNA(Tyr) deacylase [Bacteroidetes bacterium]|nr:D-tyrosyl-tRNA(Tyr) deacylase [Bacteroidota bacterium]